MLKKILFIIFTILSFNNQTYPITNEDAYRFYNNYIDENNMQEILSYIYNKQPGFFLEDPAFYFPLHPDNIEDFFYILEPLINFLQPLLWGNIVFPISLSCLSDNFDNLFEASQHDDVQKILSSEIILLKGGTYPAMKKELLFANKTLSELQQNKPLFLLASSSRLNTNIYYESFENIIADIQSTINRSLTEEDLAFIQANLETEYGLALIINRFFNIGNLTVLDLDYTQFLLHFNDYLVSKGYTETNLLFLSNNIFALYNELKYAIWALDNPEMINPNFSITFGGHDIPLKDPIHPEGILLRKLKMLTVLLTLITNNIDN
jgi:hypothetical protein